MVVLAEYVEGSSSSSSSHLHRHDVFISFRGVDTRLSFTNHLYTTLMHANINTFLDNEDIETGGDLKPEFETAIKASRAFLLVLSKNYAASTWCLDELVLILEQSKTSNRIVIPIFYHVDPTHVRNQQSSFGEAMAKHRQMMETETNAKKRIQLARKIERWNKALIEVADLKGVDANGRLEVELIDEIVSDIFRRLHMSSSFPLPHLIGVNESINFVTSWLTDASSHTADVLTILGMGGIGKSSLAKYAYVLHRHKFETSTFIEDINRRCVGKANGLLEVQKELYDDISKPCSIQVYHVSVYTSMIENAVAGKSVFLVLDDIDTLEQLDALLGSQGFHPGTKIIITTKNASLTHSCALFKTNVKPKHATYELKVLSEIDSQKLLCFHAFMCNNPNEGYEEVSQNLLKYCEGHPMALKVLGRSLHNRDVTYWEGYIDKLKKENGPTISNILRMSFDSLPFKNDKDLFKHIACFLVGMDSDVAETILKACDIDTRSGITNLVDRCLLSYRWNRDLMNLELMMHQLVQEMGRLLVREESLEKPWKRSRLWCHQESFKVLKQKKGSENILGLTLDMRMLEREKFHGSLELKADALSKLDSLMLLQLNYVHINGSYENFPEQLRWLCMHGFPLKSIPLDLPMENLVSLDLSYSNIVSFGNFHSNPQQSESRQKSIGPHSIEKRLFRSLKILNLSFCEQLCSLGGFDQVTVLERLIVRNCIGLLKVCKSVEKCVELVFVDMSYCNKIENLPRIIGMLKTVKILLLEGCNLGESRTETIDMHSPENLNYDKIGINTITSTSTVVASIPSYPKFFALSLPRALVSLSLDNNNLSTESFPMDLSNLSLLKYLCLDGNPIVSLPNFVRSLPALEILGMKDCKMLTSVEHPPHTLEYLDLYLDSKYKPLLRKLAFDPQMSPLNIILFHKTLAPSSFEFEGVVKIEPLEGVEGKIFHSLGWTKLDFPIGRRMVTSVYERMEESEIQMYYEFGIFSTIYEGEEMPNWIIDRSEGESISFTIPTSPKKLKGLNFCCALIYPCIQNLPNSSVGLPMIIISNITKNLTWIYKPYITSVVGGKFLIFLSHWMFGMNEMECGDHITITMSRKPFDLLKAITKECGISFVYDDGKEEEEDVLGYYKSWNHIIGGDLTGFQTTTGEYILSKWRIVYPKYDVPVDYDPVIFSEEGTRYTGALYRDKDLLFRAFGTNGSDLIIESELGGLDSTRVVGDDGHVNDDLDEEDITVGCMSII